MPYLRGYLANGGNNIIMSVLFIGESSPYYSPQLPPQRLQTPLEHRQRQLQYRADLQRQMRQKQERRIREREQQQKYDRDYEAYLKRRGTPSIFSTPPRIHAFDGDSHTKLPRFTTEPQENYYQTPSRQYRSKSIFTPSVFDFSLPRASRARVEEYPKQRSAFDDFVESYEQREKELRDYEDRKVEEVYNKMYNSVDALSNEEEYELVRSRLKPVRLHLPEQQRPISIDPEASNHYYRLPPIVRVTRSKSRRRETEQGGRNWREWYAREKLKELEEYYQKAMVDDQTRSREQSDGIKAETPRFAHRKNPR